VRLLPGVAARRDLPDHDVLRDRLIEARVHAATADNNLDLLQIQLEHDARGWERESPGGERGSGRE
jgi:hypothetical protein